MMKTFFVALALALCATSVTAKPRGAVSEDNKASLRPASSRQLMADGWMMGTAQECLESGGVGVTKCYVCHGTAAESPMWTRNCVDDDSIITTSESGGIVLSSDGTTGHASHYGNGNTQDDFIVCPPSVTQLITDNSGFFAGFPEFLDNYFTMDLDDGSITDIDGNSAELTSVMDSTIYLRNPDQTITGVINLETCEYEDPDEPTPGPSTGMGDPHFKSWNQEWFDYHGECDLVFLSSPQFANETGLDIHVRTKIQWDYSHIEAAAIRIGGDVFEIGGWGEYLLNGIQGAEMPNHIAGYLITHEKVNEQVHKFQIHISETEIIELKNYKFMVSVNMPAFPELKGSAGLLGDYPLGRTLARDGETVMIDMNDFGQEWQVRSNEPKLFETSRDPQFPTMCRLPEPKSQSRRLGETIAEDTARKACAGWGKAIDQCVFDVMATGDLDFAAAGGF